MDASHRAHASQFVEEVSAGAAGAVPMVAAISNQYAPECAAIPSSSNFCHTPCRRENRKPNAFPPQTGPPTLVIVVSR